jgi:hypothetical protein
VSDDVYDELRREAEEAAEGSGLPEDAGSEVSLAEGESFAGRFRREDVDSDYGRTIFLLLDRKGEKCFVRGRTMLESQMRDAAPAAGDVVAIARAEDGTNSQGQSFHRYQVRSGPAPGLPAGEDKPATEPERAGGQVGPDEDLPF